MAQDLGEFFFMIYLSIENLENSFIIKYHIYSTNCSLNSVSFGATPCNIQSCTATSIACQTQSAYATYKIDNSGKDTSNILENNILYLI